MSAPRYNLATRDLWERDDDPNLDCTEHLTPLAWALIGLAGVLLFLFVGFFCWRCTMAKSGSDDLGPLAFLAAISGMTKMKNAKNGKTNLQWGDDKARSSINKNDPSALWGYGGNSLWGNRPAYGYENGTAPPSYSSSTSWPAQNAPASYGTGAAASSYNTPAYQGGYNAASAYSGRSASAYNQASSAYNNQAQPQSAFSKWSASQARMGTSSYY